MILMKKLRKERGWSQRELWRQSQVDPHYIAASENKGMQLYPAQAKRIAETLGWEGDPMDLFEEVDRND